MRRSRLPCLRAGSIGFQGPLRNSLVFLALGLCAIAPSACATPGEPRLPGTLVQGKSGLYTLTIHGVGWKQVLPAAVEEPDLQLIGHDSLGHVYVHLHVG